MGGQSSPCKVSVSSSNEIKQNRFAGTVVRKNKVPFVLSVWSSAYSINWLHVLKLLVDFLKCTGKEVWGPGERSGTVHS